MGCDIHAYIDYDDFKKKDGNWYVSQFADNVSFNRNYTMFSLMAGVRYDAETDKDYKPLFEPRGIFERLSWRTQDNYILRVDDDGVARGWEGYCSVKQAAAWVNNDYSIAMGDNIISNPDWHSASWLNVAELKQVRDAYQKTGFYESSWFQFSPPSKQAIPDNAKATKVKDYAGRDQWYIVVGEKTTGLVSASFNAIIAAMEALNGESEDRSRLIFWFDN